MSLSQTAIPVKRFATVRQVADLYPAFTQSSLRWLIFNEKTNGFSFCTRRTGRKILIDLDAFESWLDKKGERNVT